MATSKRTDYCCVPLCRSDASRDFTVSFHRIHNDKIVRRQWLSKIRRDHGKSFTITTNTVVCSIHFMKDDFKWTGSHPLGDTLAIEMILFKSLRKCHHLRNLQQGAQQSPSLIHIAECDATITDHQSHIDQLSEKLCEQERQVKEKDDNIEELNSLNFKSFEFVNSCMMIHCWNIIQDCHHFKHCKHFLILSNLHYQGESGLPKPNSCHSIPLFDELFMFLVRIKLGSSEVDLSVSFNCHVSTISRRALTWCNYLNVFWVALTFGLLLMLFWKICLKTSDCYTLQLESSLTARKYIPRDPPLHI